MEGVHISHHRPLWKIYENILLITDLTFIPIAMVPLIGRSEGRKCTFVIVVLNLPISLKQVDWSRNTLVRLVYSSKIYVKCPVKRTGKLVGCVPMTFCVCAFVYVKQT